MKLKARTLLEQDYSMLEEWWKAWGWPPVSKDVLPEPEDPNIKRCLPFSTSKFRLLKIFLLLF